MRGLLNPYSLEGKFWRDNLVKIKADWERKKQAARSRELKRKFKAKTTVMRAFGMADKNKISDAGRDSLSNNSIIASDVSF